ncbi:hypothetical protein ACHAXA_007224 [Cyclostephanos tholiformis]|uniref:Uncharacterized protein n=1 Tax=Cyclostephanos tholiformis TaxID=382380 RepID=A0ABD3RFY4_9STRA
MNNDDDQIAIDDERHRREEAERRAKRHRIREDREAAGKARVEKEKERKRREHAARILGAQQRTKPPPPPPPRSTSSSSRRGGGGGSSSGTAGGGGGGGSSIFQSLFAERAEGFFVDLRFRNAPPRPPVGPTFVGSGLEGELTKKWTRYKARNAVESRYAWRVHPGDHLRELVSRLATSAMDIEGCYNNMSNKDAPSGVGGAVVASSAVETLSPEDEALIEWKGSSGDTSADMLQKERDRARAAARAAIARGYGAIQTPAKGASGEAGGSAIVGADGKKFKLKKNHLQSRILDERTPNFMKKTTYLTNDATSVHRFTSLATAQVQRARDVDLAVEEIRNRYAGSDVIEGGFVEANKLGILPMGSVGGGEGGNGRTHPTRKDLYPVWDLPLLPDVRTWGHTFTHVVLDNPPRTAVAGNRGAKRSSTASSGSDDVFSGVCRLDRAIVADVAKQAHNARMECTVWVPTTSSSGPVNKKSRQSVELHEAIQRYDLDVVPLRDPSAPPVHFVFTIDPSPEGRGYVGYHPIGSRVQLSMGRPVVVHDGSNVRRRGLNDEERRAFEMRTAEVHVDLAEKHGLIDEENA